MCDLPCFGFHLVKPVVDLERKYLHFSAPPVLKYHFTITPAEHSGYSLVSSLILLLPSQLQPSSKSLGVLPSIELNKMLVYNTVAHNNILHNLNNGLHTH